MIHPKLLATNSSSSSQDVEFANLQKKIASLTTQIEDAVDSGTSSDSVISAFQTELDDAKTVFDNLVQQMDQSHAKELRILEGNFNYITGTLAGLEHSVSLFLGKKTFKLQFIW